MAERQSARRCCHAGVAGFPGGHLTVDSFQDRIVAHLRDVGGGSWTPTVVGPNTLTEFGNVCTRLTIMELDPVLQQAAAAVLPVGQVLARTAIAAADRGNSIKITAARRVAPHPHVRLFE